MHSMNAFDSTLLGDAPEFRAVIRAAQVAAVTDVTMLVLGESGTGKELLARAVHRESRRRGGPFVVINCAALPETLAESELFGHRKGAFTGAVNDHPGRIQGADGGTLFLDEVAELPLSIQAKLLRFLERGESQPVGETRVRKVDVRVIAATHRDLYREAAEGRFREDLYYRLNVVPMELPPLRVRSGDIPLLLAALTRELAEQHGLDSPRHDRRALEALSRYPWPGNVRELRNFCERMVVLFSGRRVGVENLPGGMREPRPADTPLFTLPDGGIHWNELEQQIICQALARAHGNRSRAARLLGLSRDTLLYRIKKYAIGA